MKKLILMSAALFGFANLAHARTVMLKNGGSVKVSKGDTLMIEFSAGYRDGGYSDSDVYDKKLFSALGRTNTPPPKPVPGDRGTNTWRYVAKHAGKGQIQIFIFREWKKEETLMTKFSAKVAIK